jgi:hypothetical protein
VGVWVLARRAVVALSVSAVGPGMALGGWRGWRPGCFAVVVVPSGPVAYQVPPTPAQCSQLAAIGLGHGGQGVMSSEVPVVVDGLDRAAVIAAVRTAAPEVIVYHMTTADNGEGCEWDRTTQPNTIRATNLSSGNSKISI